MHHETFWDNIKKEFSLDENYIHLSLSVITPHPKGVREAIEKHRHGFDTNPGKYFKNKDTMQGTVLQNAAKYLNTQPNSIALTESTTMGLSVVYQGMQIFSGEEILTTHHEHYASSEILRFKSRHSRCLLKKISLYDDPSSIHEEEIIEKLLSKITPFTRILALTWVHSSTGLKIPISKIGAEIKKINQTRTHNEKILVCLDGLHGFGIEDFNIDDLNVDFFIAGCHKSFFGPRGTGIIWGSELGWSRVSPFFTSFDVEVFWPWYEGFIPDYVSPKARLCSPGGFGAFEHKWALSSAFDFHLKIGKDQIKKRVHELNTYAKNKMAKIKGIQVFTPVSESLSSGMVCFIVKGKNPKDVVDFFETKKIIIGQTPYRSSYNRFAISIINTHQEIDKAIQVLEEIIYTN